jgi:predicted dehydrogenase
VGFLGTGWIGRHRMAAMIDTGEIEAVAVVDTSPDCIDEALKLAPGAQAVSSLEDMLALGVEGVVIATPSALHAAQAITALDHGAAVFCQKPLGRSETEAHSVVEAAREADRLLGIDFSYRKTAAARAVMEQIRSGALGRIFAAELVFHNAYGPDKPWFYDPALAGGGCMMDLGVHLVDLALMSLDWPQVDHVSGTLFAKGTPLHAASGQVEDYALAQLHLAGGAIVTITCSWHLHAGREALIGARFHGTQGGAALRNLNGSFYDLQAEAYSGTGTTVLCSPPDEWGGREAATWAAQLASGVGYDPACEQVLASASVLDRIYASAAGSGD